MFIRTSPQLFSSCFISYHSNPLISLTIKTRCDLIHHIIYNSYSTCQWWTATTVEVKDFKSLSCCVRSRNYDRWDCTKLQMHHGTILSGQSPKRLMWQFSQLMQVSDDRNFGGLGGLGGSLEFDLISLGNIIKTSAMIREPTR